jgi:hypothetical protein
MLTESSGTEHKQKKRVNISSPQGSARRQERNYKQHAAEKIVCIGLFALAVPKNIVLIIQ